VGRGVEHLRFTTSTRAPGRTTFVPLPRALMARTGVEHLTPVAGAGTIGDGFNHEGFVVARVGGELPGGPVGGNAGAAWRRLRTAAAPLRWSVLPRGAVGAREQLVTKTMSYVVRRTSRL